MGLSWWRVWLALCYFVSENIYFGWHFAPKSDAEIVCDGITMLLVALAILPPKSVVREEPKA